MVNKRLPVSTDDESLLTENEDIQLEGYLNKWTNYIYGWQKRWVILKGGALSYYKEQNETDRGCRGAMSLFKADIKDHEFDPCRFDISVDDCVWCLRAETVAEKERWIKVLIYSKKRSDNLNGDSELTRRDSNLSLLSNPSTGVCLSSTALTFQKSPELKVKLIEIDTLRESLCMQLDNLQERFIKYLPNHSDLWPDDSPLVDFKVDVMTCKATGSSISEVLHNCIEIVSLQEDAFAKCLEQLINEKQPSTDMYGQLDLCSITENNNEMKKKKKNESKNEEELFYDAVESRTSGKSIVEYQQQLHEADENENNVIPTVKLLHRLSSEVDQITNEQIKYAKMGIGKDGWQLFADEGEMKMYRRVMEVDGVVIDPLKACHFVRGFTAHEICNYFFKPEFRYEWETTLDPNGMTVLEQLAEDTIVFHQVHKRVWPAAQRDAVFWSHMKQVSTEDEENERVLGSYIVVNHSTNVDSLPVNTNSQCVRMNLTVCLFCQTVILCKSEKELELSRKDIACKIMYCAVINPGGWVPASGLRLIYKREYPRFLRKFTAYVIQKTKDKPIIF